MIVHGSGGEARTARIPAHRSGGISFREILSCLNPLQYLPVVGTIYRAITGDEIPARVREIGSLAVSGLTGGPVGLGLALGLDIAEHATGIDPEALGRRLVASIGIGHAAPEAPVRETPALKLSDTALALGGTGAAPGFGGVEDADTLNGIELRRLALDAQRGRALDAYAYTHSLIHSLAG